MSFCRSPVDRKSGGGGGGGAEVGEPQEGGDGDGEYDMVEMRL